MKIFIDTANLDEIRQACSWGIVDGVTTNPSLIKRAVDQVKKEKRKIDIESYIKEIILTVGKERPVSLEVISLRAQEMIEEAKLLYHKFNPLAGNVVIKIPINTYTRMGGASHYEGLQAITHLSREEIPVNTTLIMSPEQALLAAKAGARYTSPFAGRVDDYIRKKLGIQFKKQDYFDFDLMQKITKDKLTRFMDSSGERDAASLYLDEKIKEWKDLGKDNGIFSGVHLVEEIVSIYQNYQITTEVIAASIRNGQQVREVALAGAHIATIPFNVMEEMIQHPKTVEGIETFSRDVVPEYR
ncbi:transaldolase, partial [Candidatus Aerophobetes bacterium]